MAQNTSLRIKLLGHSSVTVASSPAFFPPRMRSGGEGHPLQTVCYSTFHLFVLPNDFFWSISPQLVQMDAAL